MKERSSKTKFLLIFIVIFGTILFYNLPPNVVKASSYIKSDTCYSSSANVPYEISKDGKTYHRIQVVTLNGSATSGFVIRDYCRYSGNGNMNLDHQTGSMPSSTTVSLDGYSFSITPVSCYQTHQDITEYASPGYFLRGQASCYDDGHYVSISESPWHGDDGLILGWVYHTADHTYHVDYYGTAYYGIYEEVQSNPDMNWNSITEQTYTDGDTYWYKLNDGGTVPTFEVDWNDPYTDIMNSYLVLTYNGTKVLKTGAEHNNTYTWNDLIDTNYITSSSNSVEVNNGKNVQFSYKPTIIKSGIYHVYTGACNVATRWQNPSQTEDEPIDTGKDIGIDEQAPTYNNITVNDGNIDSCNFSITGVNDYCDKANTTAGSGLKDVKVEIYPVAGNDGYRDDDTWTTGSYDGSTQMVNINANFSTHFDGIYGQYTANIYFTDNVGNQQIVTKTILREKPNPEDISVDLQTWDYKDPNSNKCWIKVGNSATAVITARSNKEYSTANDGYPTNLQYNLARYNNFDELELLNDSFGSISLGNSNFTSNSGLNLVNANTTNYSLDGYKYLQSTIQLTGNQSANEKGYLISATGYTELNSFKYDYVDEYNNDKWETEKDNEYLYVDGLAPTGTFNNTYDDKTFYLNLNATINDSGSGVNKAWLKVISQDDPNIYKEVPLELDGSNTYSVSSNLFRLFEDSTTPVRSVKVEVWSEDNVGNQGVIGTIDNIDLWNIIATITRTLDPHDPNFLDGEQGNLIITVQGYVEKLKIEFPSELIALDPTLNKEITLEPKRQDTITDEFYIPLNTPYKDYNLTVTGYRGTGVKSVTPSFTVNGNILDNIRTRIIYKKED